MSVIKLSLAWAYARRRRRASALSAAGSVTGVTAGRGPPRHGLFMDGGDGRPARRRRPMTRFASLFAGFAIVACTLIPLMSAATRVIG